MNQAMTKQIINDIYTHHVDAGNNDALAIMQKHLKKLSQGDFSVSVDIEARKQKELDDARLKAIINTMPDKYKDANLPAWQTPTAEHQKLKDYLVKSIGKKSDKATFANSGICLQITGTVGVGKTYLAWSIYRAFRREGFSITVKSLPTLLKQFVADKYNPKDVISALGNGILILDEAGLSPLSKDELNYLYILLNHRYEANKSTIILSNLDMKGLNDWWGERIAERTRPVNFGYIDYKSIRSDLERDKVRAEMAKIK